MHSHTLTVPVSQLVERDGQWYAPRWLLMRTVVHERILRASDGLQRIDGGAGSGLRDVWHELWEPMLADGSLCWPKMRQRVSAARKSGSSPGRVWPSGRVGMPSSREARAKAQHEREQSRQTNLNRLETIGPTRVEWDEWEVGKTPTAARPARRW